MTEIWMSDAELRNRFREGCQHLGGQDYEVFSNLECRVRNTVMALTAGRTLTAYQQHKMNLTQSVEVYGAGAAARMRFHSADGRFTITSNGDVFAIDKYSKRGRGRR